MPWVRFDDKAPEHPKLAGLDSEAGWTWFCAMCYANRNLTDGFLPKRIAGRLGGAANAEAVVQALLDAGLWEECDGGYRIHDYSDFQPTREEYEAGQVQRREAGRKGGLARSNRSVSEPLSEPLSETLAEPLANGKQEPSESPSKLLAKGVAKVCPDPDPVPVSGSGSVPVPPPSCPPSGGQVPPAAPPPATSRRPPDRRTFECEWAEFRMLYPRRSGALNWSGGQKKFVQICRGGVEPRAILAGVRKFAEWCEATGNSRTEKVCMVTTWLSQRRWEEEYFIPDDAPKRSNGAKAPIDVDKIAADADRLLLEAGSLIGGESC